MSSIVSAMPWSCYISLSRFRRLKQKMLDRMSVHGSNLARSFQPVGHTRGWKEEVVILFKWEREAERKVGRQDTQIVRDCHMQQFPQSFTYFTETCISSGPTENRCRKHQERLTRIIAPVVTTVWWTSSYICLKNFTAAFLWLTVEYQSSMLSKKNRKPRPNFSSFMEVSLSATGSKGVLIDNSWSCVTRVG